MKYGWIVIVAMMAAMFSTAQVAAQPDTSGMSELEKLQAMEEESEEGVVSGAEPVSTDTPPERDEMGLGTQAAERDRIYKSIGEVGESVRTSGDEEALPLKFTFHGFYRNRYNWIGNAPMPVNSIPSDSRFPTKNASYGYQRLRIDPELTYGPNPDLPIARLRFTVDGFDNVVWGDNARVFSVPLFSVDQSNTDINGFDLRDSLKLERAWIEFLVPVGQVRVGRMESQWGVGLLTHAGNGLAEWGDFLQGETFDRVIFATRPITLARGIAKGDTRSTPLVYAFVYDRLTQDPVVDSVISSNAFGQSGAATDPNFKPSYTTFDTRSPFPLAYLSNLDRRVSEIVNVLAWNDEEYGRGATDELFVGVYVVYRFQRSTDSRITIPDVAWRLKHTLKNKRNLAITTEGEYYTILGHSGALSFTSNPAYGPNTPCPRAPAGPCNKGKANIHNVLARIGIMDEGDWAAQLEGGFASGDANLLKGAVPPGTLDLPTPTLKTRAFNTNVKVGLLMYQVALRALTFQALAPLNAQELGANGSVWNSKYFMPSFRFTIVNGLEVHAQFLIAWAAELDPYIYGRKNTSCGFSSECFMGWEADLALRARMGAKDIIWIDLETGLMQPKQAFTNVGNPADGTFGGGFSDAYLWTVQLRAAMIF